MYINSNPEESNFNYQPSEENKKENKNYIFNKTYNSLGGNRQVALNY
jgi:hypothetical protein